MLAIALPVSALTCRTLSINGELLSLHFTFFNFIPLSTSFIIQAQSGRFLGLDFNMSSILLCLLDNCGKSFRIDLAGGGGGGLGGGGGGIAALDELFESVGAPENLRLNFYSNSYKKNHTRDSINYYGLLYLNCFHFSTMDLHLHETWTFQLELVARVVADLSTFDVHFLWPLLFFPLNFVKSFFHSLVVMAQLLLW